RFVGKTPELPLRLSLVARPAGKDGSVYTTTVGAPSIVEVPPGQRDLDAIVRTLFRMFLNTAGEELDNSARACGAGLDSSTLASAIVAAALEDPLDERDPEADLARSLKKKGIRSDGSPDPWVRKSRFSI